MRLDAPRYLILAAVASAAMLAAAHAFQRIGGYPPCLLCLRQREVYWIALAAAGLGLLLLRRGREPDAPRLLPLLLAAVFLTGAAVASYHAGAEWKWWPAPTSCVGGGPATVDDLEALLRGEGGSIVRCDEVAWSLLGLSMAGWNALVSLALAALGVAAAFGRAGPGRLEPAHV
jgi:disulfide bond formation protein DsbB